MSLSCAFEDCSGAVPLQAKALEALDQLPPSENPILFASTRGGRIDFRRSAATKGAD